MEYTFCHFMIIFVKYNKWPNNHNWFKTSMSHSISHAEPMDQKHSINLCNHERYPVHLKCLRNIQKIKYPDFQAMTMACIAWWLCSICSREFELHLNLLKNGMFGMVWWYAYHFIFTVFPLNVPNMDGNGYSVFWFSALGDTIYLVLWAPYVNDHLTVS